MADELTAVLRAALRDAVKTRDKVASAAIPPGSASALRSHAVASLAPPVRSALGAIENAQAADASAAPAQQPGRIAGGVAGLGAGEVPRRELSDAEAVAIVRTQIGEWLAAAAGYERAGEAEAATRLRAEADVLSQLLLRRGRDAGRTA